MLTMKCTDVRRDLSAYQDEELSIAERIAIADHLENCPACSVEADDLMAISDALQAEGHSVHVWWASCISRAQSDIVERLAAEERVSLATWVTDLLEDRRRALATTGASIAACVLVVFGMCQLGLGTVDHPDSLARLLEHEAKAWAARAEMPVVLPRVNPESVMPAAVMNQAEGDESVSAFSGRVTTDGQLTHLEFLGEEGEAARPVGSGSQKQFETDLLAAASTASFQPARQAAGEPVPLNVIWLVTHRTVRAPVMHARIAITSTFRYAKTV